MQSQDKSFRGFLLELHKEKLVSMAIGCDVPRAEIHKKLTPKRRACRGRVRVVTLAD